MLMLNLKLVALERRLSTSQVEESLMTEGYEIGSTENSPVRENSTTQFHRMCLVLTRLTFFTLPA